jgi:hypothetical protein
MEVIPIDRRCVITLLDKAVNKTATGFQTRNTDNGREVVAWIGNVKRSEFYSAAAVGMKPAAVFRVNEADYSGEKLLIHEGKRYRLIKTYQLPTRQIELTCEGEAPNDD